VRLLTVALFENFAAFAALFVCLFIYLFTGTLYGTDYSSVVHQMLRSRRVDEQF
jgi:hypothetical protein